jgi:hypothetical protein
MPTNPSGQTILDARIDEAAEEPAAILVWIHLFLDRLIESPRQVRKRRLTRYKKPSLS